MSSGDDGRHWASPVTETTQILVSKTYPGISPLKTPSETVVSENSGFKWPQSQVLGSAWSL